MLKKLCKHRGCINYREEGHDYCKKHLSDEQVDFTGYQQPWSYLYHTKEWKEIKKELLNGCNCMICREEKATEIHHIIPHRGNEELFFDRDNLLPVCHKCHMKATAKEISNRRTKPKEAINDFE